MKKYILFVCGFSLVVCGLHSAPNAIDTINTLSQKERQAILKKEIENRAKQQVIDLDKKAGGYGQTAALVYQLFAGSDDKNSRLNNFSKTFLGINDNKDADSVFKDYKDKNESDLDKQKKLIQAKIKGILDVLKKPQDKTYENFITLENTFINKVKENIDQIKKGIKAYNDTIAAL